MENIINLPKNSVILDLNEYLHMRELNEDVSVVENLKNDIIEKFNVEETFGGKRLVLSIDYDVLKEFLGYNSEEFKKEHPEINKIVFK